MFIPLVTAFIISLVFGPSSNIEDNITLHIALLDRDEDFLSGILRAIGSQGNRDQNLRLHLVDTDQQGLQLLEKRKVSAFIVLPENLTVDLLDNRPTALGLYRNPAESILPRIVEEGLQVLCIGASAALRIMQPEMRRIRDFFDRDSMPTPLEASQVAAGSVQRMRTVEPYLFPPLIQFETVEAVDYMRSINPDPEDPNR
jgi:hypothetical protein